MRYCDANGLERPIFKEEFRQKYSLIYDIPDNPTKRIDESLKAICAAQKKYLDKVCDLKRTAVEVQGAIHNSRDPLKIETCTGKIKDLKNLKEKDESSLRNTNVKFNLLKKYYYASILSKQCLDLIDLNDKISDINKKVRKVVKNNKQQNTQYKTAVSNHTIKIGKLCKSYNESVEALDKLKQTGRIDTIVIDAWSRYGFNHTNLTTDIDVPDDFIQSAKNLIHILKEICDDGNSKYDSQKFELLTSLMNILKNYSNGGIQDIKILDKTANMIYDELESELKEIKERALQFRMYSDALEDINKCLSDANDVHQSFIAIPEKPIECESPEVDDDILNQKLRIQEEIDEVLKQSSKFGVYRENMVDILEESQHNPLLSPYLSLSIQSLSDVIYQLNVEIDKLNDNINGANGYNAIINYLEVELAQLQACKDHPLSRHQDRVDLLVKRLNSVQSDLGNKNEILDKIIDRQNTFINTKQSIEQEHYLKQVWNDLGKRFGQIRHMDQVYDIVEVDILNSKIVTTTGKEFSINDMGTGESQSAYLMNVLKSKQNTCILAMFDESENMDYELRQGILKKFKELYDDGHLLLGLTASHHSGSNSESIVEEYYGDQ